MKYTPESYAKAFVGVLEKTSSLGRIVLVQRFLQIVRKNGDWSKLAKIVSVLRNLLVKKDGGRLLTIESARELPAGLIKKIKNSFSDLDLIEMKINEALIAGVRITIDGERELDGSLNRRMRKLFDA